MCLSLRLLSEYHLIYKINIRLEKLIDNGTSKVQKLPNLYFAVNF